MDMKNHQVILPSNSSSELSTPIYTFERPFQQKFPFCFTIIKYMIQNPQSGKVWKKLIMLCKFFYPKYPVLPVKYLEARSGGLKADGEVLDTSRPFPKLWVYDSFSAFMDPDISTLIGKVFKFDLRNLDLAGHSLTFHDYQKLTSSGSVEGLYLVECTIKNTDDTIVTCDLLLGQLKHVKMFRMLRPNPLPFQPDTVKKVVQHLNENKNMRSFELWGIEETFDFSSFVDFLKKNETVNIFLSFPFLVSAAYKEMVENVIKEIKKNPSLKVPNICFRP